MKFRAALAIWAASSVVLGVFAGPAWADFIAAQRSTAATFAATTLAAPTAVTSTANGLVTGCAMTISWSNPSPNYASKLIIQRYNGSTLSGPEREVNGTDTSYVDNVGLSLLTSYTWKIYAKSGTNWVSPVASTTHYITVVCL